ncbi:MAG: hypothetical protein ABNH14_10690 [Pseudophaeobacter sp.]|jgi:hypothetical protein|uniref:phage tail terminator protein n=1 Tax=Pseudophaeobacter sp. TaxID=1971739 RepID=UPI00220B1567|nr:hypothetical protein N1037_14695 [Phaeobacter sp. G2]
MLDAIIQKLKDDVPDLNRRVEPVIEMAKLMRDGRLPQNATALVVPLDAKGGKADTGTGAYRQAITERIGVYLVLDANDPTGRKALGRLHPLLTEVTLALVGWSPEPGPGVLIFERRKLLSIHNGRAFYELAFSIEASLRTAS